MGLLKVMGKAAFSITCAVGDAIITTGQEVIKGGTNIYNDCQKGKGTNLGDKIFDTTFSALGAGVVAGAKHISNSASDIYGDYQKEKEEKNKRRRDEERKIREYEEMVLREIDSLAQRKNEIGTVRHIDLSFEVEGIIVDSKEKDDGYCIVVDMDKIYSVNDFCYLDGNYGNIHCTDQYKPLCKKVYQKFILDKENEKLTAH